MKPCRDTKNCSLYCNVPVTVSFTVVMIVLKKVLTNNLNIYSSRANEARGKMLVKPPRLRR